MALQFLLHSKTLAQWSNDEETQQATELLLSFLLDATKKKKSQKQAIKSICTLLRNRDIQKQPILLNSITKLVQTTFNDSEVSHTAATARKIALLHFLSAALQVMPG